MNIYLGKYFKVIKVKIIDDNCLLFERHNTNIQKSNIYL